MTVEHVSLSPQSTTPDDTVESRDRPIANVLETGGAVAGCVAGWVVVTGIFVGAVAFGTVCIGGVAAVLAAAFLAP
ncbi:hypothetical protein ITJ57_00435 [Plantibacter sp. VKM Ac-2880]|uniref:hypothetical protein n=1 Tax=Plantibacter sp. VKM Ac-2880 TaxID=2783827 RepID=UPI00188F8088|nr:hypothetical protein [Plantibacter sp. VKM Ac-2880]MBF4567218.1 hypothetical protein [Plantibacter sp. VKM Ac-2880]